MIWITYIEFLYLALVFFLDADSESAAKYSHITCQTHLSRGGTTVMSKTKSLPSRNLHGGGGGGTVDR